MWSVVTLSICKKCRPYLTSNAKGWAIIIRSLDCDLQWSTVLNLTSNEVVCSRSRNTTGTNLCTIILN
jgi:hypothetical protein